MLGFVGGSPNGRKATAAAYEHLGYRAQGPHQLAF